MSTDAQRQFEVAAYNIARAADGLEYATNMLRDEVEFMLRNYIEPNDPTYIQIGGEDNALSYIAASLASRQQEVRRAYTDAMAALGGES